MSSPSEKFSQAYEHHAAGRLAEASRLYHQVVRSDPRHARAWHQLACIALDQAALETAQEYFIRAIRLDGGQAVYHNNLGNCLRMMGKYPEAEASFRQAIRIDPHHVAAYVNLSLVLYALGRTAEGDRSADDGLGLEVQSAEDHCACATLRLLRGDFAGGWPEHEWRLSRAGQQRATLPGTPWEGGPLGGRRIVLYAEQGLGDGMQFVRYVPEVVGRGGQPVLWVPKTMVPLFTEAKLCDDLVSMDEPAPACDVHAALMSLPYLFGTTLDTIPQEVPYLRANPELVAEWRRRLADVAGYRVGIAWQGNPRFPGDRVRSIPLEAFGPLADVPDVRLVSLQKHVGLDQVEALADRFEVMDLGSQLDVQRGAFMDTAAVMSNLELVITSDTAVAHLAGALGVPVWVALSTQPDWRWLLGREDCPWYPTMRLFRQRRAGDWGELLRRVSEALRAQCSSR